MASSRVSVSTKTGIHLAHAALALGMVILLYGLKFHGPYGFMHLEGLALGLYGLAASILEVIALIAQKMRCFSRYAEIWNEFLWEAHMLLLISTHAAIYKLFPQPV